MIGLCTIIKVSQSVELKVSNIIGGWVPKFLLSSIYFFTGEERRGEQKFIINAKNLSSAERSEAISMQNFNKGI